MEWSAWTFGPPLEWKAEEEGERGGGGGRTCCLRSSLFFLACRPTEAPRLTRRGDFRTGQARRAAAGARDQRRPLALAACLEFSTPSSSSIISALPPNDSRRSNSSKVRAFSPVTLRLRLHLSLARCASGAASHGAIGWPGRGRRSRARVEGRLPPSVSSQACAMHAHKQTARAARTGAALTGSASSVHRGCRTAACRLRAHAGATWGEE